MKEARSKKSAGSAESARNFIHKVSAIFVIPRDEGSPQETPQSKSPIFVEVLV